MSNDDHAEAESVNADDAQALLEAARAEAAVLRDRWMRTSADFDNFRKRMRRELEEARRDGREDLLKHLLPVFDNLERALRVSPRVTDVKHITDGLAVVLKQFNETLSRVGISKVQTSGAPFDPGQHEAVQQVETQEHPPGTVIAETQPGYVDGGRLVRPASVLVAKSKAAERA